MSGDKLDGKGRAIWERGGKENIAPDHPAERDGAEVGLPQLRTTVYQQQVNIHGNNNRDYVRPVEFRGGAGVLRLSGPQHQQQQHSIRGGEVAVSGGAGMVGLHHYRQSFQHQPVTDYRTRGDGGAVVGSGGTDVLGDRVDTSGGFVFQSTSNSLRPPQGRFYHDITPPTCFLNNRGEVPQPDSRDKLLADNTSLRQQNGNLMEHFNAEE